MKISKWLWLSVILLLLIGFASYIHSIMIPEENEHEKMKYRNKGVILIICVLLMAFIIHYKEHGNRLYSKR